MTTVIFGGSGFIGRRLVDLLRAQCENVVCADLVPPAPADEQRGVRFARCMRTEFGVELLDLRQCVLKIIADVRADNGLPPIQTSAAPTAPDSQPDRAPARTPPQ